MEEEVAGPERLPVAADLGRLRYLSWVITEAMRLYPPVYILGREAVREIEIGGYRLSRGTICLISHWVVHRDPRFFPEPETLGQSAGVIGSGRASPTFHSAGARVSASVSRSR